MKPVKQTKFGQGGNCFPAVLASLLEVELEDVPDFMNEYRPEYHQSSMLAHRKMNEWLVKNHKIFLIVINFDFDPKEKGGYVDAWLFGYWIAAVRYEGIAHVVIMKNNEMVFDPAGREFDDYKFEAAYVVCKVME